MMQKDNLKHERGSTTVQVKFKIGQVIHHKKFDYRGVIYDVDATFSLGEAWYEQVAGSRPPKDKPWYHVLVDGSNQTTYVAERHLDPDSTGKGITHPLLNELFYDLEDGHYSLKRQVS